MTTKISRRKRMALLAAGISASMVSAAWGANGSLYELHNSGQIWRYTGMPCNGNVCPGWQELDNNPSTVQIVAGGAQLYELHQTGSIWWFTGQTCANGTCPGWTQIDNNQAIEIFGYGGQLYQLRQDLSLWQFTGHACNGSSVGCKSTTAPQRNEAVERPLIAAGKVAKQESDRARVGHLQYQDAPA